MLQKNYFLISAFFGHFWQKTAKIDQNEENCQNLNCLIKFFEILYVDASQQNKMLQKNYFRFRHFFLPFFVQKTAKTD